MSPREGAFGKPIPLTAEQIKREVVERFAYAAKYLKDAGGSLCPGWVGLGPDHGPCSCGCFDTGPDRGSGRRTKGRASRRSMVLREA